MNGKERSLLTFGELGSFQWFIHYGKLYQKLPNLNGSNAYKMYKGYRYLKPGFPVFPVTIPILESYSPDEERTQAVIQLFENGTWRYGG